MEVSSASLLSELGKKIEKRIKKLKKDRVKHKATLMYKVYNGCAPQYLQQLVAPRYSEYNLRNSLNNVCVPKPRTDYINVLSVTVMLVFGTAYQNNLDRLLLSNHLRSHETNFYRTLTDARQSCKTVSIPPIYLFIYDYLVYIFNCFCNFVNTDDFSVF